MGIGCRRDPLEANVWYVKAADHKDERAIQRLKIIHDAANGRPNTSPTSSKKRKQKVPATKDIQRERSPTVLKKAGHTSAGDDSPADSSNAKGDCVIM